MPAQLQPVSLKSLTIGRRDGPGFAGIFNGAITAIVVFRKRGLWEQRS